MGCPVCGLVNPTGSSTCDCGYNFSAKTGGGRPPFRKRHAGLLLVVSIITACIFLGCLWALYGLLVAAGIMACFALYWLLMVFINRPGDRRS